MSAIIEVKNITKKFPKGVVALKEANLTVNRGTFTAIMGPSGSGKSTLMNIMGLLDTPTEGELYINGKEMKGLSDKEAARIRREVIGFVFQSFYLNPHLSAADNIIMPMQINPKYKGENLREKAESLLENLDMLECKDKLPSEMSGGEQQRVAIARALANEAEVILADEPTGNLDEENEKRIFECLKKISESGRTVVVISHNDIVKEYADVVINIRKGKIQQ